MPRKTPPPAPKTRRTSNRRNILQASELASQSPTTAEMLLAFQHQQLELRLSQANLPKPHILPQLQTTEELDQSDIDIEENDWTSDFLNVEKTPSRVGKQGKRHPPNAPKTNKTRSRVRHHEGYYAKLSQFRKEFSGLPKLLM